MKNYDNKWHTNVLHAYHFSYKILLLISAPICHPNFSQSVPCSRLSFPDRREIDKHSLQRRNIIITNYAREEMRNNSMNNWGVKRFDVSRAVIVDNFWQNKFERFFILFVCDTLIINHLWMLLLVRPREKPQNMNPQEDILFKKWWKSRQFFMLGEGKIWKFGQDYYSISHTGFTVHGKLKFFLCRRKCFYAVTKIVTLQNSELDKCVQTSCTNSSRSTEENYDIFVASAQLTSHVKRKRDKHRSRTKGNLLETIFTNEGKHSHA